MTVKELITKLQQFDPNLPVAVFGGNERPAVLEDKEYNFTIQTVGGECYDNMDLLKDLKPGDKYLYL